MDCKMKPLEETYNKRFFCRRDKLHWRAVPICDALWKLWNFQSVIDVGCATGDIVREFDERGLDSWGVEGSSDAQEYIVCENFKIADLRLPETIFDRRFDLCLCLEVAEHIEPEYADIFVQHLVDFSDIVVLSAAPPGQEGVGHVNCQSPKYWKNKFKAHNYFDNAIATDLLRYNLSPWKHKPGIKAYYQNLIVFDKRD
ncbi:MAG: class I SAM-dependent methyltransferase [Halobacteriota archaeon]|nr:class I SAM-dependent methyltransferase [Halobacteriota archaeon]